MVEDAARINTEKIDAALREERDRLVVALRGLADTIETVPLDRISGGIAWVATAIETLVRTVERTPARDK